MGMAMEIAVAWQLRNYSRISAVDSTYVFTEAMAPWGKFD